VDLKVFLNEDRFEVQSSPDPLTMVKLRGSTGRIRRIGSILSNEEDAEAVEQKTQKLDVPVLVLPAAQYRTVRRPTNRQA
jgi:hypothetical protein